MKPFERKLLAILALVQFHHVLDFVIIMPMGPLLMKRFHLSPDGFSYIVASYTLAAGITGFLGVFWLDRFDRRKALIAAFSGFIIGTLCMAIAPSYIALLLARMLTGAFGGLIGALLLSIVGDVFPIERRAQATGIVMAAFSVASVLGVPFGLYLANEFGWNAAFMFIVAGAVIVYPFVWVVVPSLTGHLLGRANRPRPRAIVADIAKSPAQRSGLLMIGLLMIGQFSIIPFMNPYLIENVGFREDQLPLVYLVGGLLTLFSSPAIGKWADRTGHQRVFIYVAILSILPIIFLTNLPRVPVWVGLVAMGTFFMGVGGRGVVAFTLVSNTAPPARRAGLMSMATMTQHLFVSLGSVIGGWLVFQDHPRAPLQHFNWVGYIAVASTIGALICARFVMPLRNQPEAPTIGLPAVGPITLGILPTDLTDPDPEHADAVTEKDIAPAAA